MNNKKHLIAAATAALAGLAPAAAHAQVSTSAVMSGLDFTLTDLAPDDGITPSMTLTLVDSNANARAFDSIVLPPVSVGTVQGFGSATAKSDFGFAQAGVDQGGLRLSTGGTYGSYLPQAHKSYVFSVQPHTLVTFTVDTDAAIEVSGPDPSQATATMQMTGMFVNDAPGGERIGFTRFDTSRVLLSGGGPVPLSASLVAEGPPLFGSLDLDARIDARGLAPVPEPAAWTMLLAGLGLLASAGRRGRAALRNWHSCPGSA